MSNNLIILIREYKPTDSVTLEETVRNAYLSNALDSWISALTREITLQLVVMLAALLFIFMGVPLHYCLFAIPIVMLVLYLSIYSSYFMKATELSHNRKAVKCWVAEACEPFFFTADPRSQTYRFVKEENLWTDEVNVDKLKKKIIGTVAVSDFRSIERTGWLYRLAVDKRYRKKGVGRMLVQTAQTWSRLGRYDRLLLAVSECEENAQQLFLKTGFQMKQMYHKKVMGVLVTIAMYQLESDLMIADF